MQFWSTASTRWKLLHASYSSNKKEGVNFTPSQGNKRNQTFAAKATLWNVEYSTSNFFTVGIVLDGKPSFRILLGRRCLDPRIMCQRCSILHAGELLMDVGQVERYSFLRRRLCCEEAVDNNLRIDLFSSRWTTMWSASHSPARLCELRHQQARNMHNASPDREKRKTYR